MGSTMPVSHPPTTASTPLHGTTQQPGVDTFAIHTAASNAQLCAAGWHAWVPWLHLDNGSWLTWCARLGCDHEEQYDGG